MKGHFDTEITKVEERCKETIELECRQVIARVDELMRVQYTKIDK